MRLGFVTSKDKGGVDRALATLAAELLAQGVGLGGVVQENVNCNTPGRCDMDAQVLPEGPVIRISQSLGIEARGCRLDPAALEQAVGEVQARLTPATRLLIVNKFGKHEADGRGFRPVIAQALEIGVPVLVGVGSLNRAAFDAFTAGGAEHVTATPEALHAWVADVLDEAAAA